MGRAHAAAYRSAADTFDLPVTPRIAFLADVDEATAAAAGKKLGVSRTTGNWRDLVADTSIDLIDITAPNSLHSEMGLAAIAAGKHVYCEKPLAPTAKAAHEMVVAADAAGVRTMTGFTYLKNPITALAREIIEADEIGEVFSFRGWHLEDYMLDPATLINAWRLDPAQGDGVGADLGSHIISLARYLVGPIASVTASRDIVFPERQDQVADQIRALVDFENGAGGTIEASWVATGRKMAIGCEIRGTRGAMFFDFERLNELQLYRADQARGREGFKLILAGPAHKDFAAFTPAPGHQLSFNDLKTIEVKDLIEGLVGAGPAPWPDFREAWEVQRVVDGIAESDRGGGPVAIEPA